VKTLDADYSKNLDAVLGILCQMISGKSFELILSAAAVTGKLPVFAAEFIKSVVFCYFLCQVNGVNGRDTVFFR